MQYCSSEQGSGSVLLASGETLKRSVHFFFFVCMCACFLTPPVLYKHRWLNLDVIFCLFPFVCYSVNYQSSFRHLFFFFFFLWINWLSVLSFFFYFVLSYVNFRCSFAFSGCFCVLILSCCQPFYGALGPALHLHFCFATLTAQGCRTKITGRGRKKKKKEE